MGRAEGSSSDHDHLSLPSADVRILPAAPTVSAMAELVNPNMLFANFNQDFTCVVSSVDLNVY